MQYIYDIEKREKQRINSKNPSAAIKPLPAKPAATAQRIIKIYIFLCAKLAMPFAVC